MAQSSLLHLSRDLFVGELMVAGTGPVESTKTTPTARKVLSKFNGSAESAALAALDQVEEEAERAIERGIDHIKCFACHLHISVMKFEGSAYLHFIFF